MTDLPLYLINVALIITGVLAGYFIGYLHALEKEQPQATNQTKQEFVPHVTTTNAYPSYTTTTTNTGYPQEAATASTATIAAIKSPKAEDIEKKKKHPKIKESEDAMEELLDNMPEFHEDNGEGWDEEE